MVRSRAQSKALQEVKENIRGRFGQGELPPGLLKQELENKLKSVDNVVETLRDKELPPGIFKEVVENRDVPSDNLMDLVENRRLSPGVVKEILENREISLDEIQDFLGERDLPRGIVKEILEDKGVSGENIEEFLDELDVIGKPENGRPENAGPAEFEENAKGQKIMIIAEEDVLHYQETRTWSGDRFTELVKNKSHIKSEQINRFKVTYDVEADNSRVEFDGKNNSTILKCDVHGKEYSENSYDFLWFLNPHGLDLIYDFKESERELRWKGTADNTYTTVTLSFPFSIGHCHGHVWPE